ncbi:MAG: TIGR02300 family protein [Deltaproteobacteria bacterium]|nr:TIGR02300 family protein [Deltaproteobacteria bacterium]
MTPKDLGTKHTCWKCGAKFYDMKKPAPICPKCGSDARQKPASKSGAAEKRAKTPPREEPAETEELGDEAGLDKELDEDFEEADEPEDDEG